jgi:hypothetical protein
VREVTRTVAKAGSEQGPESMLLHSADYLELLSIVVIAWVWLEQAARARMALKCGDRDAAFYHGKLCAAQYWLRTELPRVAGLADLCRSGEDSYARMQAEWF